MDKNKGGKTIATNRKAHHDYFIEESLEAGVALIGTEVKSLRQGSCNLKDSWCEITPDGQLYLRQMHISPYDHGNRFNHDPLRSRRLLMHRREILRLRQKIAQQGYTLIPVSLYFKGSLVKVQIGLCKGKKLYDKRESAAKRDAQRDVQRALRQNQR